MLTWLRKLSRLVSQMGSRLWITTDLLVIQAPETLLQSRGLD